jgi:hypothetical protein
MSSWEWEEVNGWHRVMRNGSHVGNVRLTSQLSGPYEMHCEDLVELGLKTQHMPKGKENAGLLDGDKDFRG